jgi:2-dehydropantoate 2-reductase
MPNAKPSMMLDHLSKRKSEIDFINGRVELMGKEVGVMTPYNFILSSIVKNNEQKF